MELNLFTDLSEEQQELTCGGGQLIGAYEHDFTNYTLQTLNLTKAIASGPQGSAIVKNLTTAYLNTSASEYLSLYFN